MPLQVLRSNRISTKSQRNVNALHRWRSFDDVFIHFAPKYVGLFLLNPVDKDFGTDDMAQALIKIDSKETKLDPQEAGRNSGLAWLIYILYIFGDKR